MERKNFGRRETRRRETVSCRCWQERGWQERDGRCWLVGKCRCRVLGCGACGERSAVLAAAARLDWALDLAGLYQA